MMAYLIRRMLYGLPLLLGINILTFVLFFVVNTPDDMARMHLGQKHVTPEAIEKWKHERGYDQPLFWNAGARGVGQLRHRLRHQDHGLARTTNEKMIGRRACNTHMSRER